MRRAAELLGSLPPVLVAFLAVVGLCALLAGIAIAVDAWRIERNRRRYLPPKLHPIPRAPYRWNTEPDRRRPLR